MKKLSIHIALLFTTASAISATGDDSRIIRKGEGDKLVIRTITVQPEQMIVKTIINGPHFRSVIVKGQRSLTMKSSDTIAFCHLNAEMDKMQESMTQMDASLANQDSKDRKTVEDLLKAGMKI